MGNHLSERQLPDGFRPGCDVILARLCEDDKSVDPSAPGLVGLFIWVAWSVLALFNPDVEKKRVEVQEIFCVNGSTSLVAYRFLRVEQGTTKKAEEFPSPACASPPRTHPGGAGSGAV